MTRVAAQRKLSMRENHASSRLCLAKTFSSPYSLNLVCSKLLTLKSQRPLRTFFFSHRDYKIMVATAVLKQSTPVRKRLYPSFRKHLGYRLNSSTQLISVFYFTKKEKKIR